MNFFSDLYGSRVDLTPVPVSVFTEDREPALTQSEACVFAVYCKVAKKAQANCRAALPVSEIQMLTGYKKREVVTTALHSLREKGFLLLSGERQNRKPQAYELANPATSEGLASLHTDPRKWLSLRGALQRDKLAYFWMPTEVITRMPQLSRRVFVLLMAIARLASLRGREFVIESEHLRFLAGLDYKTFSKAMSETEERWMHADFADAGNRSVAVTLLDVETGQTLDIAEELRKEELRQERERKYKEGHERDGRYSPAQLLAFAMAAFPNLQQHGAYGEFVTRCPKCHNAKKNKPGLHINPNKGVLGVYRCVECGDGGSLFRLVCDQFGGFNQANAMLAGIKFDRPELFAAAERITVNAQLPVGMQLK
jgi:hypothetical protein